MRSERGASEKRPLSEDPMQNQWIRFTTMIIRTSRLILCKTPAAVLHSSSLEQDKINKKTR